MTFGEFIKREREGISCSAQTLSDKVGCSPSFIRGIERGAQFPSTDMARKILDGLDIVYAEINPFTLKIEDGPRFKFRSSVRGQNKEPGEGLSNRALEIRVNLLEDRLSSIETLVISILSKIS